MQVTQNRSGPGQPQFGWRKVVKFDVPASIVVFLVAVPLSLGIALASGAPVYSGLISAVIGGILAGFLGGSQLMVSGPAAGMVVVVAGLVTDLGWAAMCAITVCAGALQILFGLSRVAGAALAISPAVVHAMLAGIGVTIVLGQLHVILGFKAASSPIENLRTLPSDIAADHPWETAVGVATIAILLLWPKLPAALRRVPGPLVAIALVTAVATAADLPVNRVQIPGNLLTALSFAPKLPDAEYGAFLVGVITVALIASVENLLSAVAVDKLHKGPRARLNRELVGQGITNMACGAVGGLPVTGVIVRSSTNVMAGARTRWSTILHGVWVLVFTVALGGLISNIPMASLAGLLVYVGIKLVDVGHIRTAHRHGDILVYAATLGGVILLDLMQGVFLGLAVAVVMMLRRTMWSAVHAEAKDGGWHVIVEGALSFLSTPRLSSVLGTIPEARTVHLDLVVDYLDHSAFETISDWQEAYEANGGRVIVHEIGHPWLSSGKNGTPTVHRKAAAASVAPWMAPWSDWQSPVTAVADTDEHRRPPINAALHRGMETYRKHTAATVQPMMNRLADRQSPKTLLITCADSRIVPNMITASGPGDLFVVRNIGNLVPPHQQSTPPADTSVAAAVEYAVVMLGVEDIVVCGHSSCGAMTAALAGAPEGLPGLHGWLELARPSVERLGTSDSTPQLSPPPDDESTSPIDELSRHNVLQQLDHLRSYPAGATAEREGKLRLAGMYFDIATAHVFLVEDRQLQPS
ncbi:bifunctional SulP family inorganic anion transporter/carbonic anhydrase [Nocardia wallacei]|uniref:bifunctional SulP family inorganic anion transporter/carbonic anhydrase n=1 Tax=Nocardia wallacei TaxID=480035 RepID=UPI0024555BD6|nr:bifunctional SulP family inorganic anion transporter/carbonic anhydrase [Nocardia wallacei]